LGEVNIKGVELDVAAQLTDRLSLIAALTYHDSEITKNNEGRQGDRLANTPNFASTLRLSYLALDSLRLGGSLIYVGDRQGADFGTTFTVDGYTRLDLDASWRVPYMPGLTLFAVVENVTDEDYVLGSRDTIQIQRGRPQTFTLRARYDF
jgi:iron complex outermembrane receptor protein